MAKLANITQSNKKTYRTRKSSGPRPNAKIGLSNPPHLTASQFSKNTQSVENQIIIPISGKHQLNINDKKNKLKNLAKYDLTRYGARLIIKKSLSGESLAYVQETFPAGTKRTGGSNNGRKKGVIVQKELSKRGKKVLRQIADCYEDLVKSDEFRGRTELNINRYYTKNNFITLTFRNIIPDDKTSKILLDSFFKRLVRHIGRKIHFIWVAERQKRGAIHFHILTPECIYDYEAANSNKERIMNRVKECVWVNKNWNEVVANWALKSKKISKSEHTQWLNEYKLSENYYTSKMKLQYGMIKTPPRRPKKSTYLLLPNLISVSKAGNYMTKYMSKEKENIIGGMYGASTMSREFLKEKIILDANVESITQGNKIIEFFYHRAKSEKRFCAGKTLEHNGAKLSWLPRVNSSRPNEYKFLEWYYEFKEIECYENTVRNTKQLELYYGYDSKGKFKALTRLKHEKNTMNKKELTLFKVDTG